MCGIFGVLHHNSDRVPEELRLDKSAQLLKHRGPDFSGIHREPGLGLVHTRLSLLDLQPRSNQPFWDSHNRYALVYNGEIYNFLEIKQVLEHRGYIFRTTSDTETLLYSLIADGVQKTVLKLEGMFAFALYDKVERTLLLARDRFGMKPLFIYETEDSFLFSSEIQAMRPWLPFNPDMFSISSFLFGFGGPTKGHTFFHNIKSLPPGTILRIRTGHKSQNTLFFSMSEFWDQTQAETLNNLKPQAIVDQVEDLLLESVRNQLLVADVPVGALCSGGVDSSLLMAMAVKFHSNLAIFHANIVGQNSEREAAACLAQHLGLELKTVDVSDEDFLNGLPDVIHHFGHPYYECPQAIPVRLVSQLINHHQVKAVLSGEGSDECYLGYEWVIPNVKNWRQYIKDHVKKFIHLAGIPLFDKKQGNADIHTLMRGLYNRFEMDLDKEEIDNHLESEVDSRLHKGAAQSLELLNYGLRGLLHRNDSMGMSASVESRFPFLDTTLVKYAVNVPYKYKVRFSPLFNDPKHPLYCDKWIIREVAKRYLPKSLSHRVKKPFPVDAYNRLNVSAGFFHESFVSEFFSLTSRQEAHLARQISHSQTLRIKFVQLEIWAMTFLMNESKESILGKIQKNISVRAA